MNLLLALLNVVVFLAAVVEVLQLKVQAQLAVQQQQMATAGGPSKS